MFGSKTTKDVPVDQHIFAIYDSKVQSYDMPVFAVNEHDLTRQIVNMFKDPEQKKNRLLVNAEDFSLFRIGFYSKKLGKIVEHNAEHIANMHDLRAVALQDGALHST